MNEMSKLLEYLVEHRSDGADPCWFSDVFERLMWLQDDNGSAIQTVLVEWLERGDEYRALIALGLEESFLFTDRQEMAAAFDRLLVRFPDLSTRCQTVLQAWDTNRARAVRNSL